MRNFFLLGRNPALSVAEIIRTAGEFKSVWQDDKVLIVEGSRLPSPARLGGIIGAGEIIAEVRSLDEARGAVVDALSNGSTERILFGVSGYGFDHQTIERFGLSIKKALKDLAARVRFVSSKDPTLSAVVVTKNHLIEEGGAFVLVKTDRTIMVGRVTFVQEFEEFSARDYGRPGRDPKSGMLPPKLARIMLNLSGAKPDDVILDPFCGSGTIVTEAMILGFKKIIGSDKEARAVADTKQNIEWTVAHSKVARGFIPRIEHASVETVDRILPPASVDAIITEPFLGPPLRGNESPAALDRTVHDLQKLYRDAFSSFSKILKPNGTVVFIFPAFRIGGQIRRTAVLIEDLQKNGLPRGKAGWHLVQPPLLYDRPDQRVAREIVILKAPIRPQS